MTVTEPDTALPTSRPVRLMIEDRLSSDGRIIAPGALTWREPPLTVVRDHSDHTRVVGSIRDIVRAGNQILGVMDFDLDGEDGREIARHVRDEHVRGLSVELGDVVVEFECTETDEEGFCIDGIERTLEGRIGAIAVAPFPAIEGAEILAADDGIPAEPVDERQAVAASGRWYGEILDGDGPELTPGSAGKSAFVAALVDAAHLSSEAKRLGNSIAFRYGSGANWKQSMRLLESEFPEAFGVTADGGPMVPPRAWFSNPDLTEPTALTISDDGRVFGHVAAWGTCHIGRQDICLTPPRGTDYRLFLLGERETDDGTVAVGQITLGTDHPDTRWAWGRARDHYADTGCAVADIVVGEDAHGIWCAGALRPDATDEQVVALKAAKLSGDWRPIEGRYELVAALGVNTPGFPIPRPTTAIAASGEQQGLVAVGIVTGDEHASCGCDTTGSRLDRLEAIIEAAGLEALAVEAIAASLKA